MAELTRDIAGYLIANGIVTAIGQDLFLDSRPPEPPAVVCLIEYPGQGTETGIEATERRIQVVVRDHQYQAARAKSWEIFNLLDKAPERGNGLQLTGERWAIIKALQTPALIEVDSKGRQIFVFNIAVVTARD